MNTRIVVFDCEIQAAIPLRSDEERLPDIEYCDGWHDIDHMGVSVLGAWQSWDGRYRVMYGEDLDIFLRLLSQRVDVVVTFNGANFDVPLLAANGAELPPLEHWDLLQAIWTAAGLEPVYRGNSHKPFSLDAMARANGFGGKSGSGAEAPVLWQRGQHGQVVDYCLHDVWLTVQLLQRVRENGSLVDPRHPRQSLPIEWPHG